MIQVGKLAPDFCMPAYKGGEFTNVKLSDYRGKNVMLFFYPGDFTFVWTTEVAAVAARYKEFTDLDVEVIGVSVDSIFVHKVWDEQELSKMIPGGIPYPMASDADGSVGRVYGVYDEEAKIDHRGMFLIDPDGVVQSYEIVTPPVGRDISEPLRKFKAMKLVRSTNAQEVAPVGWQPGKSTLKPNPDLVGKVYEAWSLEEK